MNYKFNCNCNYSVFCTPYHHGLWVIGGDASGEGLTVVAIIIWRVKVSSLGFNYNREIIKVGHDIA